MGEANGIKVDRMKILGYMISNGLIALSGALLAQNNGYADMNMGTGTIVNGLAAIILAEVIVKYLPLGKRLWSIVVGAVEIGFSHLACYHPLCTRSTTKIENQT